MDDWMIICFGIETHGGFGIPYFKEPSYGFKKQKQHIFFEGNIDKYMIYDILANNLGKNPTVIGNW